MTRLAPLALVLAACGGGVQKIDCDSLTLEVPAARGEHASAWDAPRGRLVMFGGNQAVPINCAPGSTDFVDGTWAWIEQCDAWAKLEADTAPKARGRYALGHDEAGEQLLLHGGRFRREDSGAYRLFDDTWSYDLRTDTWTELATTGSGPSARSNHAAVVMQGELWVFGGNTSADGLIFEPKRDLFALDLETNAWRKVEARNKPPGRLYHAMTTDGSKLYVYGGGDEDALFGSGFYGDLWSFDPSTGAWKELHAGGDDAPTDRIWSNLVHDAERDQLLMFAGHDLTELGNLNDLWSFDLGSDAWTRLREGDTFANPALGVCDFPSDFADIDEASPERREAGSASWTGTELVVSGGKTDCGNINDVWTFDPASESWTERFRATTGEVCLRTSDDCSSMCF